MVPAAAAGRRKRRGGRLRRAAEHAGAFIAVAALVAVVLGIVGFRAYVPGRRFTEYLYRSLQLFVIYVDPTGARDPSRVPAALDVARFLAPATAAAASIRAVLALFGQRATEAWVRSFVREHVVVCGLGPLGARLAMAFRDAGHRVVAIEADGSSAAVHDCRSEGVVVLVGDVTDHDLLGKAGVASARYLVVTSDDDTTNADTALAARRAVAHRRRPLPCFVHVGHPGLSRLLVESALAAGGDGPLRLEFFDAWESAPSMVLDEFPPGAGLLVVGTGRLALALVVHAARRWAGEPSAGGRRLPLSLVGPDAGEIGADLCRRYPRLDEVCDLRARDVRIDSADFDRAAIAAGAAPASVYVAVEEDASGLQAALTLARVLPGTRVVVLSTERSGLATLVSGLRPASSPIALFDVLERTCRPEILLNGTIELLAGAIHRRYVRDQLAAGRTASDSPSLRDWDELPDSTKEANRAQAADVGTKLASIGCRIRPWTDWTGEGLTFAPGEIERMAELEHERWCRERAASGWTFGPTRDDRRRSSPYLVPWAELAGDVQDYDRAAVRALPELLTHAGFEIVRGPAPGPGAAG
ncbi:MAG: NAD-binding protein [Actinomycetota bacterium]|nr:NAD-binding protein [Actinomycetota bacterium]